MEGVDAAPKPTAAGAAKADEPKGVLPDTGSADATVEPPNPAPVPNAGAI